MVTKKNTQQLEHALSLGAEGLDVKHLLPPLTQKDMNLLFGLSPSILNEINRFIRRNSLAVIGINLITKKEIHKCCCQCLKSHIERIVKENKLNFGYMKILNKLIPLEAGHKGYYMDKDKLIKI